ncbi:MAG: hypothetical protein AB1333_04505 [Patescibacteria group bacterium]
MKKILIVDDDVVWQEVWSRALRKRATLLPALSIKEAEKIFSEHSDIDLIAVDACVPGDEINTKPLIRKFRETYKGPMIAISKSSLSRECLVSAGCDHECEKKWLPGNALRILELT